MPGDVFGCHNWWWVGDATIAHCTMCTIAPTDENALAPSVNSATVENTWTAYIRNPTCKGPLVKKLRYLVNKVQGGGGGARTGAGKGNQSWSCQGWQTKQSLTMEGCKAGANPIRFLFKITWGCRWGRNWSQETTPCVPGKTEEACCNQVAVKLETCELI